MEGLPFLVCRSCATHGAAFHACLPALKGSGGTSIIVIRGEEEQMGCCRSGCAESFSAEGAELPQQHGQKPLPQVCPAFPAINIGSVYSLFLWHELQMLQHMPQFNSLNSNCSAAACMTFTIVAMVAACMPLQQQFGIRLTSTACHGRAA